MQHALIAGDAERRSTFADEDIRRAISDLVRVQPAVSLSCAGQDHSVRAMSKARTGGGMSRHYFTMGLCTIAISRNRVMLFDHAQSLKRGSSL
jgi:hypothetical protein